MCAIKTSLSVVSVRFSLLDFDGYRLELNVNKSHATKMYALKTYRQLGFLKQEHRILGNCKLFYKHPDAKEFAEPSYISFVGFKLELDGDTVRFKMLSPDIVNKTFAISLEEFYVWLESLKSVTSWELDPVDPTHKFQFYNERLGKGGRGTTKKYVNGYFNLYHKGDRKYYVVDNVDGAPTGVLLGEYVDGIESTTLGCLSLKNKLRVHTVNNDGVLIVDSDLPASSARFQTQNHALHYLNKDVEGGFVKYSLTSSF